MPRLALPPCFKGRQAIFRRPLRACTSDSGHGFDPHLQPVDETHEFGTQCSGVAQRKRVRLITLRSEDRNLPPLLLPSGTIVRLDFHSEPPGSLLPVNPRWCSW